MSALRDSQFNKILNELSEARSDKFSDYVVVAALIRAIKIQTEAIDDLRIAVENISLGA